MICMNIGQSRENLFNKIGNKADSEELSFLFHMDIFRKWSVHHVLRAEVTERFSVQDLILIYIYIVIHIIGAERCEETGRTH